MNITVKIPGTIAELQALSDENVATLREQLEAQHERLRLMRMAVARECEDRATQPRPPVHTITGAGGIESQEG